MQQRESGAHRQRACLDVRSQPQLKPELPRGGLRSGIAFSAAIVRTGPVRSPGSWEGDLSLPAGTQQHIPCLSCLPWEKSSLWNSKSSRLIVLSKKLEDVAKFIHSRPIHSADTRSCQLCARCSASCCVSLLSCFSSSMAPPCGNEKPSVADGLCDLKDGVHPDLCLHFFPMIRSLILSLPGRVDTVRKGLMTSYLGLVGNRHRFNNSGHLKQ